MTVRSNVAEVFPAKMTTTPGTGTSLVSEEVTETTKSEAHVPGIETAPSPESVPSPSVAVAGVIVSVIVCVSSSRTWIASPPEVHPAEEPVTVAA